MSFFEALSKAFEYFLTHQYLFNCCIASPTNWITLLSTQIYPLSCSSASLEPYETRTSKQADLKLFVRSDKSGTFFLLNCSETLHAVSTDNAFLLNSYSTVHTFSIISGYIHPFGRNSFHKFDNRLQQLFL